MTGHMWRMQIESLRGMAQAVPRVPTITVLVTSEGVRTLKVRRPSSARVKSALRNLGAVHDKQQLAKLNNKRRILGLLEQYGPLSVMQISQRIDIGSQYIRKLLTSMLGTEVTYCNVKATRQWEKVWSLL